MRFTVHMERLVASRQGTHDRVWKYSSKMGARGLAHELGLVVPKLHSFSSFATWPDEPEWDGVVIKPEGSSNSRGVLPLVRTDDGRWRSLLGDGTKPWLGWKAWSALELERHRKLDVDPYEDRFLFEELVDRRAENGARFLPYDWKCYAIGGRVAWVNQIDKTPNRRASSYRVAHWWRSPTGLARAHEPIILQKRSFGRRLPRPRREEELLQVADRIARFLREETGTPFIRIDLFEDDDGTVVLGELTPHPSGGRERYSGRADVMLGQLWSRIAQEDASLDPRSRP